MRIPVIGLLGRTGERRPVQVDVDPSDLGDEPWGGLVEALDGPVRLDLTLEAVSDGILVRGQVAAVLVIPCARCLAATRHPRRVEVTELHRRLRRGPARGVEDDPDGPEDAEEYRLVDGDTALEPDRMVRDAVLLDVPVRVLCRPDCAGLCPVCGTDRNAAACTHGGEAPADPRWAALQALRDRLGGGADPSGPAGAQDPAGR